MTDGPNEAQGKRRSIALPGEARAEWWLERRGDRVEIHSTFTSPRSGSSGSGGGWQTCKEAGCIGERVVGDQCFSHADRPTRKSYLTQIASLGRRLSLNGNLVSQEVWDDIVASDFFATGGPAADVSFVAAEISAPIRIEHKDIAVQLDFTAANVFSHIEFRKCKFTKYLSAKYAFFNAGALNCNECEFSEDVDLSYSKADRVSISLSNCDIGGRLVADGLDSAIHGNGSTFRQSVSLRHSRAFVIFPKAVLMGEIDLFGSELVSFQAQGAVLERAGQLGPCTAKGTISLNGCLLKSRLHLDIATSDVVDLSRAQLESGGLVEVSARYIELSQAKIAGSLRVSGKPGLGQLAEVRGLINADAGNMSFAYVDMSKCSFFGAHGLGNVEIDSTVRFAKSAWWRGGRPFIADEFAWREGKSWFLSSGWKLSGVHVGEKLPTPKKGDPQLILLRRLEANQVAAIYRELRRSIESKSNMQGAAVFYFGEMEMRRWSAPIYERALLWAYFWISGYGLRAWRAFASWGLTVLLTAWLVGTTEAFDSRPQIGEVESAVDVSRSLVFAARATLPGVPTLERLTPLGQLIELIPRILGPLTIALLLISIRAKLMRKPSE